MPTSTLPLPEGDDDEKKDPLDSGERMDDIILVESLEGAAEHPAVTMDVSSIFIRGIDQPGDLPRNPNQALQKLLWMWWNDSQYSPSQKAIADCFGTTPALYYYALKHFSDPAIPFSPEEREDLFRQLLHHVRCLTSGVTEESSLSGNNRPLEFCWYLLVRLLTIEDQVRSRPPSALKEEHLSLIHHQYAYLIRCLYEAKRNGYTTISSLVGWLEEKLIDLGRKYPHLKTIITPLLKADILDTSSKTTADIQRMFWDRYVALFVKEQEEKQLGWETEKILQDKIARLLSRLRETLIPSDEEYAWDEPLEYIAQRAKEKKVICIDQAYTRTLKEGSEEDEEEGIEPIDQIELALFNRLSSDDTAWIFADAQIQICPFHDILEQRGNPKSLAEIMVIVEQYVNGKHGEYSLQTLLWMEGESNPHVQDCLLYWEAVRNARKKNNIYLINGLLEHEQEKIVQMVQSSRQTVVLGGGRATVILSNRFNTNEMLTIHHQPAQQGYPDDHVCIPNCLGHTAHELGNKNGWGDFDSSAVPLRDNLPLLGAIFDDEFKEESMEFGAMYAIPLSETEWQCKDILLFTRCDDDDGSSSHSPVHSDQYVHVGS